MAKSQDGIRVEIYDQQYFMRGDLDADYVQRLAQFVDGRMRSIAERTHTVETLRVAILAALNIADEYHQLKERHESAAGQLDQKITVCNRLLDDILGED